LKQLIVTADDFGAAPEINEAVEAAHRNGILTAASLMVSAPAAPDAVKRARQLPSLRVGLHLVLVDGRPMLPPAAIPDLVEGSGHFRRHMAASGARMFFSPHARRQLAAEISAQFEAFRATGLALDHVNAHKHFHLHPTIAGMILRIGKNFGLRAARVPLEPGRLLSRIDPPAPMTADWMTSPWARLLRRRFRRAGILTPDRVFGLRWSGHMDARRIAGILRHLPEGLSEIYLHPASRDDFAGAVPGYAHGAEADALTNPGVVAAARAPSIHLGGFTDFLPCAPRENFAAAMGLPSGGRLAP
jgi:hopanoid biosynthesis associated protein HpnK